MVIVFNADWFSHMLLFFFTAILTYGVARLSRRAWARTEAGTPARAKPQR